MKKIILAMLCITLNSGLLMAGQSNKALAVTAKQFYANPAKYEGKTIKLTGVASHLCQSLRKIFLAAEDGNGLVRVNIEGNKKFEKSLIGKDITVVGKVYSVDLDEVKGCHGGKPCGDDKKASTDGKIVYYVVCQNYEAD